MTYEEIKMKLEKMMYIERNIQSMEEDLERIKGRYIKSIRYTDVHIASSRSHSGVERIIEIMDKKEERLCRLMIEKELYVSWFEEISQTLRHDEIAVLRDRFVSNKTLESIAKQYKYADRFVVCKKISTMIEKLTTFDNKKSDIIVP